MWLGLDLLQGDAGTAFQSNATGWDETTDVCTWQGVTCNANEQVTMLNLNDAKLEGTIPESLGNVATLTHVYLASNSFQGPVPASVANLPNLQVIDLSFNKLNGSLPQFVSPDMMTMELGHNQFTGQLSANAADGMTGLEIFDIKYNLVTGTIPSLAASLPSLIELDLSNNQFLGTIPGFIGQLSALRWLFLSNNKLSGTIPVELTSESLVLEEIYLHGNLLTGTLPAALADLPELTVLFIDDNKITGTVPKELCDRNLNEAFFDDLEDPDIDQSYSDLYGTGRARKKGIFGRINGETRGLLQAASRRTQREEDPTTTRGGCSSIACPAGYQSRGDNDKDGVFPCERCESEFLNPYIGSNKCFEINQEVVVGLFYDATNGETWGASLNWSDSNVPTCEKEGVTCNANGDVTSIDLPGRGLSGSLPPELGFLAHLKTLNVKDNAMGGKLPADLRFAPLELLDIANNVMTGFVPVGLCQKAGVNGNGKDGIFTCDTIACHPGTASSIGRADAGTSGTKCSTCDANPLYLGSTACSQASTTSSGAITPFGLTGEITLAVFSLGIFFILIWVYRRSAISRDYIKSSYEYPENEPNQDEDLSSPEHALNGLDGSQAFPPDLEIQTKGHEWSSEKESKKEVWLDVPKIK